MVVIGVTGNIGSGKSTVCQLLAGLGAAVIDADESAQKTYKPHSPAWREIITAFGTEVLQPDEEIDRARLAEVVFSRPEALRQLNQIVHPKARKIVMEQIEEHRRRGTKVVVLEATLLIEANWTALVDRVWLVTASRERVVQRLARYTEAKRSQVLTRLNSQMPAEEKIKYADEVIHNEGDIAQLREKITGLWKTLAR
jgi:dephospho-CoA kinase